MFACERRVRAGFTMVEVLVVIALIGVLSSIFMVSLQDVREAARDDKRMTDLGQIALAWKLQEQSVATMPVGYEEICSSCTGDMNDIVENLIGGVQDPSYESGTTYYYDGEVTCGSESVAMLVATMERDSNANTPSICDGNIANTSAPFGDADSYHVILR